jgi:hypothetical protein
VLEPLRDADAVAALELDRVRERAAPIFDTVRLTRVALDLHAPKVSLIGFAGSPWTVAAYMVEGHGSRDFHTARGMAFGDPTLFGRLIRTLVEATTDYLTAQIDAAAGPVPPLGDRADGDHRAQREAPASVHPGGGLSSPGWAADRRIRAAYGGGYRGDGHRDGSALRGFRGTADHRAAGQP